MRAIRSLAALGLVASLATGCAAVRQRLDPAAPEAPALPMPDTLRETGTRVGLDVVSDWIVLEARALGRVSEVDVSAHGAAVIATWGVWDARAGDGSPRWTRFEHPRDGTVPYDMRSIGAPGSDAVAYVNRGGNWHPVGTFDARGAALWRSPPHSAVNRLAAGDLEGDGRVDLVLGFNGDGGLQRLSSGGETIWEVPGRNVWSVELTDLDGDGRPEIVHGRSEGDVVIRDAGGAVVATRRFADSVGPFALEADPRTPNPHRIVFPAGDAVVIADLLSGREERLRLRHPLDRARVRALRARMYPAGDAVYAVLADFSPLDRSVLAIHTADGLLLYETVLPFACSSLQADVHDAGGDVLVVGCEQRVLLFGRDLPMHRRALALRAAFFGRESPAVAEEERSLAWSCYDSGRTTEAEHHAQRAIALVEGKHGAGSPEVAGFLETLALVRAQQGRHTEAERLLLQAIALSTPPGAPNHENLWAAHFSLGGVYDEVQRGDLAAHHYEQALAALPDGDASSSWARARIAYDLARVRFRSGRHDDALRAIEIAIAHDLRAFGPEHVRVQKDRRLEGRIRAARGDREAPASPEPSE